jgi:transcription termination/antitermination protein NusG
MKISAQSNIYVIQVLTGKEELYRKHVFNFRKHMENYEEGESEYEMIIPKRTLTLRRRGKWIPTTKPIFPSYVFLVCESLHPDSRMMLRRMPGYIRFMKEKDGRLTPLTDNDRELLLRLTASGENTRRSVVTFDKDNRVVPLSGPLKDCEGTIIKVDRRKQRARVRFMLNDKTFVIDFEYEELSRQKKNGAGAP